MHVTTVELYAQINSKWLEYAVDIRACVSDYISLKQISMDGMHQQNLPLKESLTDTTIYNRYYIRTRGNHTGSAARELGCSSTEQPYLLLYNGALIPV
jgi:hypothetical protein